MSLSRQAVVRVEGGGQGKVEIFGGAKKKRINRANAGRAEGLGHVKEMSSETKQSRNILCKEGEFFFFFSIAQKQFLLPKTSTSDEKKRGNRPRNRSLV